VLFRRVGVFKQATGLEKTFLQVCCACREAIDQIGKQFHVEHDNQKKIHMLQKHGKDWIQKTLTQDDFIGIALAI
jgi:hypothetical protein